MKACTLFNESSRQLFNRMRSFIFSIELTDSTGHTDIFGVRDVAKNIMFIQIFVRQGEATSQVGIFHNKRLLNKYCGHIYYRDTKLCPQFFILCRSRKQYIAFTRNTNKTWAICGVEHSIHFRMCQMCLTAYILSPNGSFEHRFDGERENYYAAYMELHSKWARYRDEFSAMPVKLRMMRLQVF